MTPMAAMSEEQIEEDRALVGIRADMSEMTKTADHSRPGVPCRQEQVADSIHRAVPLPPHIFLHRSHPHPIIAE